MSQIKTITKLEATMVQEIVRDAVQHALNEYGLKVSKCRAGYNSLQLKVNFEIKVSETENGMSPEQAHWDMNCFRYGLTPEMFGKEFIMNSKRLVVTGLNTRRHKYPVSVTCLGNNKEYKVKAHHLKDAIFKAK